MDDSTLTVVYTRVVTGTAVVFVSVVGCVDVTTGNDVCDTGRAVLVDVDVSDDVPVTSSKVVVAVVGWLACEASRPLFWCPGGGGQRCLSCGQFIFSYSLSCFWLSSCLSSCR